MAIFSSFSVLLGVLKINIKSRVWFVAFFFVVLFYFKLKLCFLFSQNLPSCSINIQSFQKLPKICSTWSLWCKEENEAQEGETTTTGNYNPSCDQSTSHSSISLTRVPPKLPRHHRKMPFRRRNWCGCIQVKERCSIGLWGQQSCQTFIFFDYFFHNFLELQLTNCFGPFSLSLFFGIVSHYNICCHYRHNTKQRNYEMFNFSIKIVAKEEMKKNNFCSHLFCNWEEKYASGQEKVTAHPALDFRVQKNWFFFRVACLTLLFPYQPTRHSPSHIRRLELEREKVFLYFLFFLFLHATTVYLIEGTTSRFMNVVNFCLPSKKFRWKEERKKKTFFLSRFANGYQQKTFVRPLQKDIRKMKNEISDNYAFFVFSWKGPCCNWVTAVRCAIKDYFQFQFTFFLLKSLQCC